MKNKFIFILLIIISLLLISPSYIRYHDSSYVRIGNDSLLVRIPQGASSCYTDDFSYSGDINGQGNWVKAPGSATGQFTGDGSDVNPSSSDTSVYYYNVAMNNDQSAELYIDGNSSIEAGVIIRYTDRDNYYTMYYSGTTAHFDKKVNGVVTSFGTASGQSYPLTIKVSAVGTTLTVYINDIAASQFTNTADGTYSDSDLSSGYTGLFGYGSSVSRIMDNFEACDL